jgi:hypothetical protein
VQNLEYRFGGVARWILSGQVAAGMVQGPACRGAAAGQLNHDVTHLQGQRIEALAQVRGV